MPKLTDTQLVILSTAAQRDDGAVQPLPKSLKLQGGAVSGTLKSLLKKGLLAEQPATRDAAVWRETPGGERLMLVITDAGRQAVSVEPDLGSKKRPAPPKAPPSVRNTRGKKKAPSSKASRKELLPAARRGTKQSLLIDFLSRRHGATIAEAVKATGWQPHSVRGAISGNLKKKLGLNISSEKVERRGRVYRIKAGR
ncbi:MAG: DUF3489 domain-containing protein [Beijerinckiaceae bacterium]